MKIKELKEIGEVCIIGKGFQGIADEVMYMCVCVCLSRDEIL